MNFSQYTTYVGIVVHDRADVVRTSVRADEGWRDEFKVAHISTDDVIQKDLHIIVTVGSSLLVYEAQCVSDLMRCFS